MATIDILDEVAFERFLRYRLHQSQKNIINNIDNQPGICECTIETLKTIPCCCGGKNQIIEWTWDDEKKSGQILLDNNNKDVNFHQHLSRGTAVICGSRPMACNQHYWEIKMLSQVYGTDMMIGIGTEDADIYNLEHTFCSILGKDNQSWGLSYTGAFHHCGIANDYCSRFGQGSVIGVHLDMWNGTISFYKNSQYLGTASTGLKGKTLYAMASSTAARSKMRILRSCSFPSSLQFLCCNKLRKIIPPNQDVLDVIDLPPGLKLFLANNLDWLLRKREPL